MRQRSTHAAVAPFKPVLTLAAALILAAALLWAPLSARANAASLAGTWSGSGAISLASGQKEKARCRAQYSPAGGSGFAMSATCATQSAKVEQTARLKKVGANSYVGKFYNAEYGVSGSIRVTLNGNRQSVWLSGVAGTASFSLSRR